MEFAKLFAMQCSVGLFVLTIVGVATADEPDRATPAEIVAPFVGKDTLFLVRSSQRSTDVGRLFDKFGEIIKALMPIDEKEHLAEEQADMTAGFKTLETAGGTEYYFVALPVVVIIPLPPSGDRKTISEMYPPEHVIEQRPGALIAVQSRAEMDELKAMKVVRRPKLRPAFAAAHGGVIQVILLPPRAKKANKTIADEGLNVAVAALLKSVRGGGAMNHVSWVAAGVDLTPRAAFRLTVKCKGPEAAKELRDRWQFAL
ncbi:MAG TPA: hypothetical protein VHY20_08065, partial [Pirellulales bacterium]|nr:hypothetical protein [Pirellulales bacterium]